MSQIRDVKQWAAFVAERFRNMLVGWVLVACCINQLVAETVQPATTPAAVRAVAPHPVTRLALNAGVMSCVSRIDQAMKFLVGEASVGTALFIPSLNPDRSLISASLEVGGGNQSSAYVGASFAPGMANGCGGSYESVVYWEEPCAEVASRRFPGAKKLGVLSKQIAIYDGGNDVKVFLMNAGKGCVSIKKELFN